MSMRIPRTQYEWDRPAAGTTEKHFYKGADLAEGVVGLDSIDTKFENTERLQVMDPHGDLAGRPMPRDAKFYEADNHFEWGPDKFDERLKFGSDGPFGDDPYHGMGLPSRKHLSPNANPAFGGMCVMADVEDHPQAQGVGGKTP
jgi:hypothetical protein